MRVWKRAVAAVMTLAMCIGVPSVVGAQDAGGLRVHGLTDDGRLLRFNDERGSVRNPARSRTITGLSTDTSLVGIDFRIQDGNLYGVGNAGGIYVIDTSSGAATKVSQLTVALSGAFFGVDFNPAADRLRIISDTGQNLRHNVNAGGTTATDATLTYTGPAATGVTGAAYTNNDLDTNTGTILYDIDSSLDQLVIQAPPNNGTLNLVGKLVLDTSSAVGFDIFTPRRGDARGLASLTADDTVGLYRINLFTGQAAFVGVFRSSNRVVDIAVQLARS